MVHDYNQAINYCKKLYYITEDERVLFSQADCYLLNGNFEQAHSLYIRVLKASHRGFDMNMYWNLLLGITYTEFQLFRNQKAELANFFQQIARKVEVIGLPLRPWIIFITQMFARLLALSNQPSKAVDIHLKILTSTNKMYPNDNLLTARTHLILGKLSLMLNQASKALESLENAIKMASTLSSGSGPNHQILLADCYKSIAKAFMNKKDLSKAIHYFGQAYATYEANFGQYSSHCAEIYQEFATIYHSAKDYANALSYLAGALDIFRKVFGESSPQVAEMLIRIAEVKFETRDFQDVLQILEKAEKLVFHPDRENSEAEIRVLSKIYLLFGKTLKKLKDYSKAIEYLNKCLITFNKAEVQDEFLLANIHDSRGTVFQKICDNYKALEEFEKCYILLKEIQQENSNEKVKVLKHIGNTYQILGNSEKAHEFFSKAIETKRALINSESDKLIVSCYFNMGIISHKDSRLEKAKEYLEKALNLGKEVYGENHSDIPTMMTTLGKTIGQLGNFKAGVNMIDEAYNLLKKLGKSESLSGVNCLFDKATLLESYGDKKRAKEIFQQCLTLATKLNNKESNLGNIINDLQAKLENNLPF